MIQTQSQLLGQTNTIAFPRRMRYIRSLLDKAFRTHSVSHPIRNRYISTLFGLLISVSLGQAVAAAPIVNGNFNAASGTGPTTLTTGSDGGIGPSAARSWKVFNDNAGTTTTELLPSPNIVGGKMIHVTTTNIDSGLYQEYSSFAPNVYTCAWIYINSGAVGVGSGFRAATTIDATLYKSGSWEVLNVGNISQPAAETIIYSQNSTQTGGAADFYVESIQASTSQAQCTRK